MTLSTSPEDTTTAYCKAIEGFDYDIHQHALGIVDARTREWTPVNGEPYCIVVPWQTPECPPRCADHHRTDFGVWIHHSPYLDGYVDGQTIR